ncbi:hypothetical protein V1525DRAFT_336652 [Lipomyces kononenkoae]|uniref:Uncharacterized protein n=1 Tax=Lipomyces kononenkoae TaxID=34357 RepID=A0ACC3T9A8_LIPKO
MKLDHIAENVLIALGRHPTKEPLNQSFVPLGVAGYITKRMNLKRLPEKMDWDSYDPPRTYPRMRRDAGENVNNGAVLETSGSPESVNHSVVVADTPEILDKQSHQEAEKLIQSASETNHGEPMEGVEAASDTGRGIESIQDSQGIEYARIVAPHQMDTDPPICAPETAATRDTEPRSGQMTQSDEGKALGTLNNKEGTNAPESSAITGSLVSSSKQSLPHNVVPSVKSNFQELKEPLETSQATLRVESTKDITTLQSLVGDHLPVTLESTSIVSTSNSLQTPPQISSGATAVATTTIDLDDSIPQVPLVKEIVQSDQVDKVPIQFPTMVRRPTREMMEPSEPARATSQPNRSITPALSSQNKSLVTPDKLVLTKDHRRGPVNGVLSESDSRYKVYNCGWHCIRAGRRDVCAQLHNVNALKAHVFMKHRNGSDVNGYRCLWDNCHNENNENLRFDSIRDFDQHMLDKHIQPIEATFGSGPSVDEELKKWPEALARNSSSLLTPLAIPMSELRANARKKQLNRGTANARAKLPRQLKETIKSLKTYGAGWSPEVDGQVDTEVPSRTDSEADDVANVPRGNLGLYYSYVP